MDSKQGGRFGGRAKIAGLVLGAFVAGVATGALLVARPSLDTLKTQARNAADKLSDSLPGSAGARASASQTAPAELARAVETGLPQVGAWAGRILPPPRFDGAGRALPSSAADLERAARAGPQAPAGPVVRVASVKELRKALEQATPGSVIEIAPGTYEVRGSNLGITAAGLPSHPITVRAARLGQVRLQFRIREGFHVRAPFWVFENLIIEGTCRKHNKCDHAFHIVGDADGTVVRNNVILDFNSHMKINGLARQGKFPDGGLVEFNTLRGRTPRQTDKPATPIDVVGASDLTVRRNVIADFHCVGGKQISYAAFIKGNASGGILEQNLVICELLHRGGIRLGLSFGGGGTGSRSCVGGDCTTEHTGGIIRNNIIMHCPADVGIYLNRSAGTVVHNNILYNTLGIDVRFDTTDATVFNNVVDGRIKERNGGRARIGHNLTLAGGLDPAALFAAPEAGDFQLKTPDEVLKAGQPADGSGQELGEDFCGRAHDRARPDIGPFSYRHDRACPAALVAR